MKAPARQVLLQAALFIVQFSMKMLETTFMDFFYIKSAPNGCI